MKQSRNAQQAKAHAMTMIMIMIMTTTIPMTMTMSMTMTRSARHASMLSVCVLAAEKQYEGAHEATSTPVHNRMRTNGNGDASIHGKVTANRARVESLT